MSLKVISGYKATSFLVIIVALTACAGPAATLSPGERVALGTLDLALRVEEDRGEEIWPGFSLVEGPVLIHRPGQRSFLVGAPRAPGDEALNLPDLPHLPRVVSVAPTEVRVKPTVAFSRGVPLRGIKAFLIRHTDRTNRIKFFRFLVHEIFHDYQQRHFADITLDGPLPRYPVEDVDLVAGALVEQQTMARTLVAPTDEGAREGLALALAYRSSRYQESSRGSEARRLEDWEERLEGTARYVEDLYLIAAGLSSRKAVLRRLSRKLESLSPEDLQKWRYYHTGQALMFLMDRLVSAPWQHRVDDGSSPAQAAHRVLGPFPPIAPPPGEQEAALGVVRGSLTRYLKLEQAHLEAWPTQGEVHVVVHGTSPTAVTYSGDGVTFYLPDGSRFISHINWFVDRISGLDIRDRSVVLKGQHGTPRYRVEFYGGAPAGTGLLLDGVTVGAEGRHEFKASMEAAGAGWELAYQGPGAVEFLPSEILIQLEEPATRP